MRVFLYALLATFIIGAGSVLALNTAQRFERHGLYDRGRAHQAKLVNPPHAR